MRRLISEQRAIGSMSKTPHHKLSPLGQGVGSAMKFIATWVIIETKTMVAESDSIVEANKIFADTKRADDFETSEIRHEYEIKELTQC